MHVQPFLVGLRNPAMNPCRDYVHGISEQNACEVAAIGLEIKRARVRNFKALDLFDSRLKSLPCSAIFQLISLYGELLNPNDVQGPNLGIYPEITVHMRICFCRTQVQRFVHWKLERTMLHDHL